MILFIDTSAKTFELALYEKSGNLVDKFTSEDEKSHSDNLLASVEALLQKNDYAKADLETIAVNTGPGSYTGLRVGVATANALAFALNIPIVGIKTNNDPADIIKTDKKTTFSHPAQVYYENSPHITKPKPLNA